MYRIRVFGVSDPVPRGMLARTRMHTAYVDADNLSYLRLPMHKQTHRQELIAMVCQWENQFVLPTVL